MGNEARFPRNRHLSASQHGCQRTLSGSDTEETGSQAGPRTQTQTQTRSLCLRQASAPDLEESTPLTPLSQLSPAVLEGCKG